MHMMRDSLKNVRVMLLGNRRWQLFKYVHEFRIINAYTLDFTLLYFFCYSVVENDQFWALDKY